MSHTLVICIVMFLSALSTACAKAFQVYKGPVRRYRVKNPPGQRDP